MSHVALKVSDRLIADELGAARHEPKGQVRCRILAVRQLALGHSAAQVQGCFGLGKSQLYEWVQRYNAQGLEGLRDRSRSGAPQRLAHEQEASFLERLHDGPPPDSHLAAYRGEDLRHLLKNEFGAIYLLSGVYALLHRLGQSSRVPRPHHPQADPAAQEAFKKSAGPAGSGSPGGPS
jgi:transposase